MTSTGPLTGLRVLEMAAIGPVPFAGMMLADYGAEVIRVDRPGTPAALPGTTPGVDVLGRGKRSMVVDLKHPKGAEIVLEMAGWADVLLEGLRPGVMERLGVGPDDCARVNERLIYGRMTGYGQQGPWAAEAGHDITYIALSGVLGRMGRAGQPPTPPLNLVGDFGGGALFLVTGVLAALHERERSGRGQLVDAAMVDGSALLTAGMFGARTPPRRGAGLLDGGAPFYDTFETADGRYLAAGPIEPQFWTSFVTGLGLDAATLDQADQDGWPALKEQIAAIIRTRPRDEWVEHFAGTDACVAPVLEPAELVGHPHHQARDAFVEVDGVAQPAPAPRWSRSVPPTPAGAPRRGDHTDDALAAAGCDPERVAAWRSSGALG
ncbi:MAG: CaiB/BaiF CoA transferase family protein [Desertimonas sp.]